jgi:carboxymethylenebutenolidase
MRAEFVDHSANAALATMSATPHLNHVLVMTGGIGREEIRAFYAERFIPQMPQDAEIDLVSLTSHARRGLEVPPTHHRRRRSSNTRLNI